MVSETKLKTAMFHEKLTEEQVALVKDIAEAYDKLVKAGFCFFFVDDPMNVMWRRGRVFTVAPVDWKPDAKRIA